MPNPCGLLVAEAILAVADVAVGQTLHHQPRLEQARLRVLHGPPPGAQVLDDLEGAKHQPIPGLQVPGALRQGPAVLGADRAGPHEVEVPQGRLVQFHDVAADGGLELGVQVHGNDLPAPSREGPANRPRPTEELEKPRHPLSPGRPGDEAGHLQVADHAVAPGHGRRRVEGVLVGRVHPLFLVG